MAISKRMRFEILRRDNHTCRYCGQTAPDVKLAVDHVLPTALGGTDDPNNLVTACTDCNNGKTSTSPDSELVADIDNHTLLMQAAYAKAVEARNKKRTHVGARINSAIDYWNEVAPTYYQAPIDAKGTLRHCFRMGITLDDVEEAMDIALGRDSIHWKVKWSYFRGIIRNYLKELEESAKDIFAQENPELQLAQPCGHCDSCMENEPDDCLLTIELHPDETRYSCMWCGREDCLFELGVQYGHSAGWQEAMERVARRSAPKEGTSHG